MEWFLQRISSKNLPVYFGFQDKQSHKSDFEKLIKKGVLVRSQNLNEIDCKLCDEDHQCQVRNEKDKLFYICENGGGRQSVSDEELAIFEYNNSAFLKLVASELQIKIENNDFRDEGTNTPNALYGVGVFYSSKVSAEVLYLRTDDPTEASLCIKETGNIPKIFISNVYKPNIKLRADNIFFCTLKDILADSKTAFFDRSKFVEHLAGMRQLQLNKETGQLSLNGKLIYTPEQFSPHHWFLLYLWDAWEVPRTYTEIYRYVRKNKGKEVQDTAQKFCHKMKSEIKKKCEKDIDKIILIPSRGSYMMTDP